MHISNYLCNRTTIYFVFFYIIVTNCVTKQHYVSIFFTRLWSVRKPLLFDTHNPGISGFSTAHAYKYKTKWQAKMKRDGRKMKKKNEKCLHLYNKSYEKRNSHYKGVISSILNSLRLYIVYVNL